MTWCTFYHSKPVKYSAMVGSASFLLGSGCSLAIAFGVSSKCSKTLSQLITQLGSTVNIPELTATINPRQHSATITLNDIEAEIPQNLIDMLNDVNTQASNYCFYVPLAFSLFLTCFIALTFASMGYVRGVLQEQKENEEQRLSEYTLLSMSTN